MTSMAQKLTYAEKAILSHPKPKPPGWSGKYKRTLRALRFQGVFRLGGGSRRMQPYDPGLRKKA